MAKKLSDPHNRGKSEATLKGSQQSIEIQMIDIINLTNESLILLQQSEAKIGALAKMRSMAKLSNSRVVSVNKEIRELIKVLSQYCRD